MSEQRVRDLINDPRRSRALRQEPKAWNMVCAALDTLGDTELAARAYLDGEIKGTTHGATYLVIYGVLQVLFVQQDALTDLAQAVKVPFELPESLKEIRGTRNAAVGHPTNHQNRSSNTINRNAMSINGFELFRYALNAELQIDWIDLRRLVLEQNQSIAELLEVVKVKLENEEIEHRRKWRKDPIRPKLSQGAGYAFEKLGAGFRGDPMGAWGIDAIKQRLDEFNRALDLRGLTGALPGVEEVLSDLKYPLQRLSSHFEAGGILMSSEDGAVFVYFVEKKFQELVSMAHEIDQEYASDDV